MNPHAPHSLLAPIHRLFADERRRQAADGDLLRAFAQQGEEAAFAELLRRHGPMILRLALHLLHHRQDAEDVFQATFLTLARKAHSLRNECSVAAWLHRVAWRLALRSRAARQRTAGVSRLVSHNQPADAGRSPNVADDISLREAQTLLHQELAALPERLRQPLVLCYLQGRTRDEAARRLGWSLATLKRRLEQGRKLLHARLSRRGVALSAALSASLLASAEVSASLAEGTLGLAASCAVGSMTALPASVASLLKASSSLKVKALWGLVLMLGACAGTGAWVYQGRAENSSTPAEQSPPNRPSVADKREKSAEPKRDLFGDPLPPGAVARLGTVRLRHGAYLRSFGFTPDGKSLVSIGNDGVRVWETASGKLLRHFGSGLSPWSIALSADSRLVAFDRDLAVSGPGGPVEVWDVASSKLLHKLGDHHYPLLCLTPDGKRLATFTGSESTFIQRDDVAWQIDIWDTTTGRSVAQWSGPKESVRDMKFSADGKTLLLGGPGKTISIRDAANGKEIRRIRDLPAEVNYLAVSPRGDRIAFLELWVKKWDTGQVNWGPGARMFLLDLRTGKELRRWTASGKTNSDGFPENGWWDVRFSPDGRKLAACQQHGPVRIWDMTSGAETSLLSDGRTHCGGVAFSPDGKILAVGDSGVGMRLIDVGDGRERVALNGHRGSVTALAVAADGRTVFTATEEGMIHRWDARTGRELRQYPSQKGKVASLAFSTDGQRLYSVGPDDALCLWDVDSGKQRRLLPDAYPYWIQPALSPDGQTLAVPVRCKEPQLVYCKELHLVNAATGEPIHKWTTKTSILNLAISADGSQVMALTGDLTICRWQTATGRRLPDERLPADPELPSDNPESRPGGEIWTLSPEGRFAAHAFSDKFLRILDVDSCREVHRMAKLPGEVSSIAFAPDGRSFAWSEKSGVIHWLEMATGNERRTLPGHAGAIGQMVFTADSTRLISASNDATALVWDLLPREVAARSAVERDACWSDLADKDAAKAYRALCRFVAAPVETLAYLRSRLKPVKAVEEKQIERQIADLDADAFAVREKATQELQKLGELAEPAMRKALASRPTLEMRRRLQGLLDEIYRRQWQPSPELLRQLRALEVLERLGTPEAQRLLKSLSGGAAGARLTREARAAVLRLSAHPGARP